MPNLERMTSKFDSSLKKVKREVKKFKSNIYSEASPKTIVSPIGKRHPSSLGDEVIILQYSPDGEVVIPLKLYSFENGWDLMENIRVGPDQSANTALKGCDLPLILSGGANPTLTLLRHPWSGGVKLSFGGKKIQVDLYSPDTEVLILELKTGEKRIASYSEVGRLNEKKFKNDRLQTVNNSFDKTDFEYYAKQYEKFDPHKPIGLYVPRWRGVAMSTRTLFDQYLPIPKGIDDHPKDITPDDIKKYAKVLLASGGKHFVISGGDLFNIAIIKEVLKVDPSIRFDQLWHSNYLQMGEEHDWYLLKHWIKQAAEGNIKRIGVVKEGLEKWFQSINLDSVHIPNLVRINPSTLEPSNVSDHVGIWLSGSSNYRKMPYAMLLATNLMPGVKLSASGIDDISTKMISDLNIPFRNIYKKAISKKNLDKNIKSTGLTLYVTLSECSPMVPLESFALGVPCLVGPSSHLFKDHKKLSELLIVKRPLDPSLIAEKANFAIQNQHQIIELYKNEAYPEMEKKVDEALARFTS